MAVVVKICGLREEKKRRKHRQLPFRRFSWSREQLGQYGSLVQ